MGGSGGGGQGVGAVPPALSAAYGGNRVLAATKFGEGGEQGARDITVPGLVAFENTSVGTALEVARALGARLWGVRLDTSETLVDRSLWEDMGDFKPTGVNERLVWKVRDALDAAGFERVKLVGISDMSDVLGTIPPVRRIADAAHAAGALVLVDAAQYVPHLPTDVIEMGADFFAFTGHKMLGPTGIGVLWGRYDLLETLPPFLGVVRVQVVTLS